MSTDFADKLFAVGVQQAKAERERLLNSAHLRAVRTPIVQDMRSTARELGIVDLLLEHQRVIYQRPGAAYDLVEAALIRLGVTSAELLANMGIAV